MFFLYICANFTVMIDKDMTTAELLAAKGLASEMKRELTDNILPYWMNKMCNPEGGFHGRIDGCEVLDASAPIGGIMTARILWTFASAYRLLGNPEYLEMALKAKNILISHFYDSEFGGTYWSLNADYTPLDTKKQIYAIAFAIYGLAELNRATGDEQALDYAIKLFHAIEDHSYDEEKDGYFEAFTRSWEQIEDMRLSEKDANENKTMNTHLHVIEAYTCLYRVWKDSLLEKRLRGLIDIFDKYILAENGHLKLFFDDDWNCGYDIFSYGHDIEASWLLHEAALVLGDKEKLALVESRIPGIVAASTEGFTPEGGMIYEKISDEIDADRHWWVQAEAAVGYFNLWEHFGAQEGLENAIHCWEYIKNHIIDKENGEWVWSIRADGSVNRDEDKAGFWKCPYHNGRMCLEIIERTTLT